MSKKGRSKHVGKNPVEKQNYSRFLKMPDRDIDNTEEGNGDIDNTDASLADSIVTIKKREVTTKTGKSLKYSLRDLFDENILRIIIGGIIVTLFGSLLTAYVGSNREIGEIKTQLMLLENDTTYIIEKYQPESNDKINNLDQEVGILKVEFTKDIDYLKSQLQRIESQK